MKRTILRLLVICFLVFSLGGCSTDSNGGKYSYNKEKIDYRVVEGNTEFSFDLFRELNKEDENNNIFISPLSVSTALTMTYQGARNSTRDGMGEALNYKDIDNQLLNESYQNLLGYLGQIDDRIELNINNSIWIREGEAIKQDFIEINKNVFDAYVAELDFSKKDSADKINRWIKDSTNGKIEKMIDDQISSNVIMYLINAIYFKGEWTEQFEKENTFETEFQAGDGETQEVKMMSKKGEIEYGAGDDFEAVKLSYGNEKTSMYLILPKGDASINTFINNMDSVKWEKIRSSISKREDVILQIPRFKIEYGIKKLNDSLTNLGMGEAFTDSADFSGIRDSIFINRVLHKAVIEVNEEGSEAAGVTVVEMVESAAMEPITFIADKPFTFIIADEDFGTILFMGKMYNVD
ncbi:MAG: proteinase IV [Desulfitibacter sp. BRH_c19]|nr:MAG: proteinase IV [Desulfitibacter sp. BRH_c19]